MSGSAADADMTAMVIQALAPYREDAKVKEALDKAVETLSKMQNSDGGFSTFSGNGNEKVPTAESTAQVIVALTALGIDPHTDSRFIKNGMSVVDALTTYFVEGGGFKHVADGTRDGMATEQGYYALTAYYRLLNKQNSLYDMTDVLIQENGTEELPADGDGTNNPGENTGSNSGTNTQAGTSKTGDDSQIVLWAAAAMIAISAAGIVLITRRREEQY